MAEHSAQERTEKATPKRLREARRKGQVPRSRELTTAAVVLGSAGVLLATAGGAAREGLDLMRHGLSFTAADLSDSGQLPVRFFEIAGGGLAATAPLLAAGFAAALLAPMLLGGWNFSSQALMPQFSRLDPVAGIGRMFSMNSLIELGKSLVKFLVLALIAWACWYFSERELLSLAGMPVEQGVARGLQLSLRAFAWLSAGLLLIAAVDVPVQLWTYYKQLRMTKQEVREEMKESEGRPEVKGRIRRLQQEMAQRSMMEKVPKADVVVTNPTHYAVALKYTAGKMHAPRVVAKGADLLALTIRELARKNNVPLLEAPPLARALYRSTELDQEIPVKLYAVVAEVLTYVYRLRAWRGGPQPQAPVIGAVEGGEPD